MDGWDLTLLLVAGYVAVTALVRLMARRREQMMADFRREVKEEKRRREAEKRQAERQHVA